jgi:hypothetical protein
MKTVGLVLIVLGLPVFLISLVRAGQIIDPDRPFAFRLGQATGSLCPAVCFFLLGLFFVLIADRHRDNRDQDDS